MGPWCTQEMSTLLQVAPPPSSPPPTTPSLPSLPSFGGLGVKCIASNNKQCKFPFKFRRKVSTRILWEFVGNKIFGGFVSTEHRDIFFLLKLNLRCSPRAQATSTPRTGPGVPLTSTTRESRCRCEHQIGRQQPSFSLRLSLLTAPPLAQWTSWLLRLPLSASHHQVNPHKV